MYNLFLTIFLSNIVHSKVCAYKDSSEDWIDANNVSLGYLWVEEIDKLTYDESVAFCESRSAHLIEIESVEQMNFLVNKLRDVGGDCEWRLCDLVSVKGWWGGATDEKVEGTWVWSHSENPVGKFVWADGEPNNCGGILSCHDENHLAFRNGKDYHGVDVKGSIRSYPLCQRKRYSIIC